MALDSRLRALESEETLINERMTAIQESVAKKTDVTTQKVWVLGGTLSDIVVRETALYAAIRALFGLCCIFATQIIIVSFKQKI